MPRLRGARAWIAVSLVLGAGALAAGCGSDDGVGSEGLASFTPPDVPVYVEGVLRPEGDQVEAVESFAERIGGVADPGAELIALIDQSLSDDGLDATYSEDIEPVAR